jgi:hypothetical protein
MNFEIFKAPDPSGKFGKETYVQKNYLEEYNYIIDFCNKHNLEHLTFKQKVYHFINNIKEVIRCRNKNCNKPTNYKNSTLGYYDYCSNICVSNDPHIKKIKENKSLEKFGTKTPAESKEIKDKIIKTNNERYGSNSPLSNKKVKNKSNKTLLSNYGVTNPSHNQEILKKRVESFIKNIDGYKESYKKTSIEKYGVEHPWMNKEIHEKTIESFYKDYKMRIKSKLNDKYCFVSFKHKPTELVLNCSDCLSDFTINPTQFYHRSKYNKNNICTNCYPISDNSSLMQLEVLEFIRNNYNGDIIPNAKEIIKPYEIDIFLPYLNIGFEFNGLHWHSSLYKKPDYHLKKWNNSQEIGINIFTIWEDDWAIKEDIVKSFILNKLKKTPNKIYARKCIIREVSHKESSLFLNDNHLQGECKSSIRLGLFNNNHLVSLMTFSKLRLPLSQKSTEFDFELTRFCNKKLYNVIGGASKLIKYFIKNYEFTNIHTYSDNMISNGELYDKLGFKFIHISKPGYWYIINEKREHRFNWRKHKLTKMGYDKNKTEEEIMLELGYYRVYNAGNKKWLF